MNYGRIHFEGAPSSGFFSNYFGVMSTMLDLHYNHKLFPYVDSSNTWWNPTFNFETLIAEDLNINPWNWWFQQDKSFNIKECPNVKVNYSNISHIPNQFHQNSLLSHAREMDLKYCKLQPYITLEINTLFERYFVNKNILGVMARGTEMLKFHKEYPKVDSNVWGHIIKNFLNDHPDIDNIFLVTDDNEILNNILEVAPQAIYLKDFFRKTTQTDHEINNKYKPGWLTSPSTNDLNHRKRLGEECIIQAKLLSKCQSFLGTYSGFTNAAQFFNHAGFKDFYIV